MKVFVKTLAAALLASFAWTASTPALAHDGGRGHWKEDRSYHDRGRHHHRGWNRHHSDHRTTVTVTKYYNDRPGPVYRERVYYNTRPRTPQVIIRTPTIVFDF